MALKGGLAGPFFLDTSVLIAGLIELGPSGEPAQRLLAAIAHGRVRRVHTAWHCCLEFHAVTTRLPEDFRLSPADSLRLIEEEILARFTVHDLPGTARRTFLRAVREERVVGGRVHDAHIAEVARAAQVRTVVTENVRHFSALGRHGIAVVSAAELAAAAAGGGA